ncbi:MAG: hypothetical protein QF486_00980 [Candidatus Woesearchaeota archaeon]|nr:hypothetical protein [Candidatus Woesearchaeota archaeon]MDP7198173.1 hypothetical protein [Candidatus Woesearchaeota archaeon]MDP7467008.1 hypothetical protein [Candidatus Woesearchaeota archaeon]MDP7646678.1 hypothetical protein [Candidatus Woesearchaeota archaeon]
MKKLLIILFLLVACTQIPETTEIPIPDTLPPPEQTPQPQIETSIIEGTPVHACAPLPEDAGTKYCNLTVQRSKKDLDGCEQAFLGKTLPHPYVILEIIEFDSRQEAKEKFEWDQKTTGAKNEAVLYGLGPSFIYSTDGRHVEILKGDKVLRVDEKPAMACGNFDGLAKEFYRKA